MKTRLLPIAIGLLVWLVLWLTWPIDAIHYDSSRDMLMARDCYELGRCDGHGPPTSFDGLFQGVIWTNALGLLRWLGLQPAVIGHCLAGLYALVFAATWQRFRQTESLTLCVLLLAGYVALVPVVLWSPTLFLPAMVLTTWLTLDWLERPTWRTAIGLGVLWGVTLDLYLAAGPVLLATFGLGLRAHRPAQSLAVVALALAVGWLVSPGAWLGTLAFAPLHPLRVLAVLAVLAALLGLAIRAPRLNAVALLALTGTGAWLVIGLVHHFESRYLMPGFPALCLLVAQRLPSTRAIHAVVGLGVWLTALVVTPGKHELRYSQAAVLAEAMQRHHVGWPDALAHGQGQFGRQLAPATAVFLPHEPTVWQGEDVVANSLNSPNFPAVPSRIDLAAAELCVHAVDGKKCREVRTALTPAVDLFPFASRVYESVIRAFSDDVQHLTLRLPMRAGARESLKLLPQFPGDTCPWTFADGASARELPAAATEVLLDRRFTPGVCPDGESAYDWLPPWLETPLEPAVARPLPPPPPPPIVHPVLSRSSEPLFARLAAVLAQETQQPEPDIAVEREQVRIQWPQQPPLVLGPNPVAPWFRVVTPSADPTRTNAVMRALPRVFATSPWQEADVPSASHPFTRQPTWPHLTAAALGLLVLLIAAWRVAKSRPR